MEELPKDVNKLVNLRALDIKGCSMLTHMPKGIGQLTCLETLGRFVVGGVCLSWEQLHDQVNELKDLNSLKGFQSI